MRFFEKLVVAYFFWATLYRPKLHIDSAFGLSVLA